MGKGKKKQQKGSDSEQIDDVMAWGNKKQNYYRDDENEYSQASEEYQEAEEIYRRQHKELNNQNFYQFPDEQSAQEGQPEIDEDVDEGQGSINSEYINKQIKWCSELAQLFTGITDEKSKYRNQICQNYLLILLCLKQFKSIPYLQHHPMIQNMAYLRKGLLKLEKDFEEFALQEDQGEIDEQAEQSEINEQSGQEMSEDLRQIDESQVSEEEQQISKSEQDENDEGIRLYQQIKHKKDEERKAKKVEQKQIRDEKLKMVKAFKTVNENQGRLASEKIIKNKGLVKRRKKIDGNSRVKLRQKYRKAQIKLRTKGKIGVKENPGRFYEGQKKITYGKIGSTKL